MNEENNKISSPKYSLLMAIIFFSCFIKRDLLLSIITFIIILLSTVYIFWDNKNTQNSDIKKIIIFLFILTFLSLILLCPIISMENNINKHALKFVMENNINKHALKFVYELRLAFSFGILIIYLKSLRQKLELNQTLSFCILIVLAIISIGIGQLLKISDLGIFFAASFMYESTDIALEN